MQYQGQIENWNDERGFGFVEPVGGGVRAFVHIKAISDRRRRPVDGDWIVYDVQYDAKNRPQAINIRYQYPHAAAVRCEPGTNATGIGGLIGLAFTGAILVLYGLGIIPVYVPLIYVVMSCITFVAYAVDKSAAIDNRWRTREISLQTFALIGGWPGALLGQKLLRHKTRKKEFQYVFWLIVCIHCGILTWSLTEHGTDFFRSMTGALGEIRTRSEEHESELPKIRPAIRSSDP